MAGLMRELLDRAVDPDRALMRAMDAMLDAAAVRHALDLGGSKYTPGAPFKLLLAGYSGTRNTGADVRVEEMIRQLRVVLGDDQVELSLLTIDPARSAWRASRASSAWAMAPRLGRWIPRCARWCGIAAATRS